MAFLYSALAKNHYDKVVDRHVRKINVLYPSLFNGKIIQNIKRSRYGQRKIRKRDLAIKKDVLKASNFSL